MSWSANNNHACTHASVAGYVATGSSYIVVVVVVVVVVVMLVVVVVVSKQENLQCDAQ